MGLIKYLFAAGVLGCLPVHASDLGINVILEGEIKPGVYGRVELGKDSRPEVYYPQPVVIVRESRYARNQPVYLHVPPGHAKHWDRHCHEYRACERPVYFVRSAEYEPEYESKSEHKGKGKNSSKVKHKKHDKH